MKVTLVPGKKLLYLGLFISYPGDPGEIRIAVGPKTLCRSVARMLKGLVSSHDLIGDLILPDGIFDAKTLTGKPSGKVRLRGRED